MSGEALDVRRARRLALARAGLLGRRWSGLPERARGRGSTAREAVHQIVDRFGYLQLDTVSVAGARSHALVLLSRLRGLDADLPEKLLQPGCPYFEYWGHEASWMPLELYPAFGFRRRAYRHHRWFGRSLDEQPALAYEILRRTRDEGPFRSADLEGSGSGSWWGWKDSKRVAAALWSCGELAIRARDRFQRTFDLTERVMPVPQRGDLPLE